MIDPATATFLGAALERPLWADSDVPWLAADVIDLGPLAAVDGVLHVTAQPAVDLAIVGVAEPAVVHAVMAVHPVHGRRTGAIDVVVGDGDVPDELGAAPLAVGPAAIVALTVGSEPATIEAGFRRECRAYGAGRCRLVALGRERGGLDGRGKERVTRVMMDVGPLRVDPERGLALAREPALPLDAQSPLDGTSAPTSSASWRAVERRWRSSGWRYALRCASAGYRTTRRRLSCATSGMPSPCEKPRAGHCRASGAKAGYRPEQPGPRSRMGSGTSASSQSSRSRTCRTCHPCPDGTLLIYQDTECWGFERNPLFATVSSTSRRAPRS